MTERRKELLWTALSFAAAMILGLCAIFGKISLGVMSIPETRQFCVCWTFGLVVCGILGLIGNKRLNEWIIPRLRRRQEAKEQRRAMRAEPDRVDAGRVVRRETRKKSLLCAAGWLLLLSPLIAIVTSATLCVHFKTEEWYMVLVISVLYAIQLWGLMLKTYMQTKNK